MDSYRDFHASGDAAAAARPDAVVAPPASAYARTFVALGSLAGLGAVAMAALAAHALPARLAPSAMDAVRSAVQMQGWHALALLGCALWVQRGGDGWLAQGAGCLFAVGTLFFCGAVYLSTLAGLAVPALAPVGGLLLMLGWALLGASALLRRRPVILP